MKILQIVVKNTSTMDYTIPLFFKIKKDNPQVEIVILYCVLDKRNILRKSKYWNEFFINNKIKEIDFLDNLVFILIPFKFLLRKIFHISNSDHLSLRENYEFYCENKNSNNYIYFLKYIISEYGLKNIVVSVYNNIITKIEKLITKIIINQSSILNKISPSIILFDNRSATKFPGREYIYSWMYENKIPVALLPHAPHLRDPISEFCPFDEIGDQLPDFCRFWVPMRFGAPWKALPEKYRKQFSVVGYPGLDSSWLEKCLSDSSDQNISQADNNKIKVLYILRRYMPRGDIRVKNLDPYIIDYEDFFNPLCELVKGLNKHGKNYEIILKPHPSNNHNTLAIDMKRAGVRSWSISYEPIYSVMSQVDVVVSLFSTIYLVPLMAGIPSILVKTKLQDVVHKEWHELKNLYENISYYINDVSQISHLIIKLLNVIESKQRINNIDLNHLRRYFPDGSTEVVISEIMHMMKKIERKDL